MGIGVPSYQDFVVKVRAKTEARDVYRTLVVARTEAIRRGTRVGTCPVGEVDTGSGFAPSTADRCAPTSRWNHGWISFVDSNANGVRDTGELLIERHSFLKGRNDSLNGPEYIGFDSNGERQDVSGVVKGWNGKFRLCPQIDQPRYGKYARAIIVNIVGRVRVKLPPPEVGDCRGWWDF